MRMERLNGGGSLGGNVTLGSNTLTMANASGTYAGIISGTGGNLTYGGSNTATLTSAHTYTGVTTLTGTVGLLVTTMADGGTASGIGASSNAASNLVFNGSGASASVRYNGTGAASSNRSFTLQASGGFGVYNTGALNLTSTAAIAHGGSVAAKTLLLAGNGAGGGTMAAQITDSGTGTNITGIQLGFANSANSGANWSLTNANNTFNGTITHSATNFAGGTFSYASAGGANPITFNQTASPGTGGISYIGSTDKTMSGAITANALSTGTITFDSSGTGAVNYSNTASMGVGGASGAKGLVLSGTNAGNNILAAGWSNNTAGGAATVTKNGASRWTLSGTNNYTGLTTVNAGTLQFGNQVSLYNGTEGSWTAANINVKSGATLALNVGGTGQFSTGNVTTLLTNLAASSSATNGMNAGARLGFDTTNASGGNFSVADLIADTTGASGGSRGLVKLGSGILELTGNNTFSGGTTVAAGTLLVNNTAGSGTGTGSVNVAANASLGGTGSIAGGIAFDGSSFLNVATIADPLAVTGTVTFGSGFGIDNITGLNWDTLDLNTEYTLLSTSQVFSTSGIGNFGLANAVSVGGVGRSAYFVNGSLAVVVVPEPSTIALATVGLIGLGIAARRRFRWA